MKLDFKTYILVVVGFTILIAAPIKFVDHLEDVGIYHPRPVAAHCV